MLIAVIWQQFYEYLFLVVYSGIGSVLFGFTGLLIGGVMYENQVLLAQSADVGGIDVVFGFVSIGLAVLTIAGVWAAFVKAGKPGWACIVPIYNLIVILEIAGKPIWSILLYFVPFVNFIFSIIVFLDFAKAFGKGIGFGLGIIFLPFVFFPILGFGSAQFVGSSKVKTDLV